MKDQNSSVIPFAAMLLFAITSFGAIDLILDLRTGVSRFHLISEIAILALSLGSIFWLGSVWLRMRAVALSATGSLDRHLLGLAENIEVQFRLWGLTKAESCVALLLLKGLSHQEIANSCERSERTVRQHAIAVYQKSGLAGRAELAAFFMEDLLPPSPDAHGSRIPRLARSRQGQTVAARGRNVASSG